MTKLKHRLIDAACVLVIVAVLAAAVATAIKQCSKVSSREMASGYRSVWDGIW